MANTVYIGSSSPYDFTFNDASITELNGVLSIGLVANELSIDEYSSSVIWDKESENSVLYAPSDYDGIYTADGYDYATSYIGTKDILKIAYGTPVTVYHNTELIGKFYFDSAERTSANEYTITAVSAVGLLETRTHYGGIYDGTDTVSTILASIFGDISYTVDSDVASNTVAGWLPIETCREALQQVLFSCGASLLKDSSGVPKISYNLPTVAVTIPDNSVYLGGTNNYLLKATKVTVVEHTYTESSDSSEEVLYDNTDTAITAVNETVQFSQAYHSLRWTGTSMTAYANYAVLNGTGVLYGKPYVDNQRELVWGATSPSGKANEITVKNATLVSTLNSANVLSRIANYYANANELLYDVVYESGAKPGELVSIKDQYDGDLVTGIVQSMDVTATSIVKGQATIVTNWIPKNVGNSYNTSVLIQSSDLSSGTYTLPSDAVGKAGLLVLFGGMGGGQGGYNGADSPVPSYPSGRDPGMSWSGMGTTLAGGTGGNGGSPGTRGKYSLKSISSLPSTFTGVTFGAGGTGGSANGGAGGSGGASSITSESMDTTDGVQLTGEYRDFINGNVYGVLGNSGTKGGNGGSNVPAVVGSPFTANSGTGGSGQTVSGYTGGSGCAGVEWYHDESETSSSYNGNITYQGSGGGGSAVGGYGTSAYITNNDGRPCHTHPGAGASAVSPSSVSVGYTGNGGHGGGGAGAAGLGVYTYISSTDWYYFYSANTSSGGSGSAGTSGSPGFAILYYDNE